MNAPSCAPPELARSIEHARIPADPKLERARADRLDQHESPGGRSGCLGVASSQEARGCCSAGAEPWTCDGRPAREVGGMQVAQPGAVARGPRTAHAPRQATQRAAFYHPRESFARTEQSLPGPNCADEKRSNAHCHEKKPENEHAASA